MHKTVRRYDSTFNSRINAEIKYKLTPDTFYVINYFPEGNL